MPGAIFFCRLNYIEVTGNLGRGEQLSEKFFITNDRATIESLVHPRFSGSMGTLEYNNFLHSPLAAYCKIPDLALGDEVKTIIDLLMLLDTFENSFWLHSDSCVGHEHAFILNGPRIHSNILEGLRTRADSTRGTLNLSASDFRELVRFYRSVLHPRNSTPARFHTKTNSSRSSRAFSYIGRAQRTVRLPEKITFYCSALEALFSTSQAELAHQIAERVALISSQDAQNRMQKYRLLKECYSFRSKYIHGSPLKEMDQLKLVEMSTQIDALARDAIEAVFKNVTLREALRDETTLDNYMLAKIFG